DEKDRAWRDAGKEDLTPFIKELINNKLSERLKIRTDFYKEKYKHSVFSEIFVTNKYGANIAQTGKTTDYYQADEKWWQMAKEDGLYVEDVEYDESADVYSVALCMRINDKAGNFIGAMKVVLNIQDLIDIIKELEARGAREGRAAVEFKLMTKDGKLIYAAEKYEVLKDLSDEEFFTKITDTERFFTVMEREPGGVEEELFAYALSKGYKDYKGLGWILVVEHETEETFAPIIKLRNILLVISLAVTISAVLIGLFIARSISNPITILKNATVEIGKGELDTKIEVKSKDEIGELAKSFTRMTENLKRTRDELIATKDYTDNIIKSMVDTLIVVDPDGKIRTVNKATSEFLGYTEKELINQPVGTIIAKEEEEEEEEEVPFKGTRLKKLIAEGSIRDYDMTYKTKTGEKIPVSFSGS
ncbi:unnamed protein product, partial [marine sediment metagenome]